MQRLALLAALLLVGGTAVGDSLFSKESEERGSLVANKQRRFEVGDIVTVYVREAIDATTQSTTNTKKESDIDADAPIAANPLLVQRPPQGMNVINPGELPNWEISIENEQKSRGQTQRTNRLNTTVACQVTRVHPNGNVEVSGEKRVTVNREDSKLIVQGMFRAVDVSQRNTADSAQMANAVIELRGQGPLWNNERRGLLTRLLDWVSPF